MSGVQPGKLRTNLSAPSTVDSLATNKTPPYLVGIVSTSGPSRCPSAAMNLPHCLAMSTRAADKQVRKLPTTRE